MHKCDILFLLRKNTCYGFRHQHRRSSGLWNSINFIVSALKSDGIHAHIEEVHDSNSIDKWLTIFKPKVFVAEALWVPPYKFEELKRLHPKVKMYCRLHSGMPFLALEGIAMEWIRAYAKLGIGIMANSKDSYTALRAILKKNQITYMPNIYIIRPRPFNMYERNPSNSVHVAISGAVRPMKNHLTQAMAAIQYAKELKKHLFLHINGSRVETNGEPVLKNLVKLFEDNRHATLVQHDWMEPVDFIRYLGCIDIGLQVSLTETFSIVSADYVAAGIPMVVSKEVAWASRLSKASDADVSDIVKKMHRARKWPVLKCLNKFLLWWNSQLATRIWLKFAHSIKR